MKVCKDCKQEKDESEFYADKKYKDGKYIYCRACARARTMARTRNDHDNGIVRKRDRKTIQIGETCTMIKDPASCYVTGCIFNAGEVLLTLAEGNWADGTRFFTRAAVRIGKKKVVRRWVEIVYEVSGTKFVQISRNLAEGSLCHNCLRDTPYEVCTCGYVICPECRPNDGHEEGGVHWIRRLKGQSTTKHPHYARRRHEPTAGQPHT